MQVWCWQEQWKNMSSSNWHWKVSKIIQNKSIGLEWLKKIMTEWEVVSQKIAVSISNSFYDIFCPILVRIPNLIQIGWDIKAKKIGYWSALFGHSNGSEKNHSHYKFILCCVLLNISPHTKSNHNCIKNTTYWRASVGRLGRSKISIAISNSFYVVLCSMLPHNKFYSNQMKIAEVRNCYDYENVKTK